MTADAAPVAELADPVWELIDAITNVNTYDGEIVDANGAPTQPPVDQDGRVHAYAVYYPGPGWAHALLACGGTDSLDWSFQVTCVGADRKRTLWCVDKVRAALSGKRVTVAGQGLLITEVGNPGPIPRNDKVTPPRFFVPLIFAVNA